MKLSSHIEALLFLAGEPLEISRLCKILDKNEEEISNALNKLEEALQDRGLRLVRNKNTVMLGTAPESSKYCEDLSKEELDKTIGKAGLETLAIILYKNAFDKKGVSRSDIDYVRGVNSTFTLRNLSIRGLVERKINPKDKRSFIYTPSNQLLQYLGITGGDMLPKMEEFKQQIENALEEYNNNN
jgi:segregation and condensation protein B